MSIGAFCTSYLTITVEQKSMHIDW